VHVECEVSADRVRVAITDEGPGFDPASVPDCTAEERLEAPSGRGVMLMRSFMTSIEYNAAGNAVVLEKVRGPADS
jgi:serine/threonine-protein kinase RsbW